MINKIWKYNTIGLLICICIMEKAIFRLGYVSADSIIPFFLGCLVFVMAKKAMPADMKNLKPSKKRICLWSTAICFSSLTVLGSVRELYVGSILRILFDTAVVFAGLTFLFIVFLNYAYDLMELSYNKERTNKSEFKLKRFLIYAVICMVGWTPLFLRFYPGSFGADSINQIRQAMHLMDYGNHLPVVSTWLIELFYNIGYSITGNVNAALAFYTVFQMLITALTYSACICYLEMQGLTRKVSYTILGVLAICPMIAMYAIYIHKDTPAADLLLLLIVCLHRLCSRDYQKIHLKKSEYIGFAVLSILFMLFRSNHYFVYLGLFICMIFASRLNRRFLMISMLMAIIAAAVFKGPILKSMNITGADTAETLSMPLQMVAYTIKSGGDIQDKDKEFLNNIIPYEKLGEVYSEISANPVKRIIRDKGNKQYLEDHKGEFVKLFLRVAVKNPAPCLIALVDHSKGYYCPKFTCPELIVGTWENEFGAYTDSLLPEWLGERVYLFCQEGYDLYEKYLGCGMATWLTIFLLFFAIYKGKNFITYMPSLGVVATFLLASPNVGRFRYQYPVMTAAILLVGFTLLVEDAANE